MSWAYGTVNGREVGYSVAATCDQAGCETKIDRGLGFCCGGMHGGGEHGCGGYFCGDHLFMTGNETESAGASLCALCDELWLSENPDEQEDDGPSE